MRIQTRIDYEETPEAIADYHGITVDIYPILAPKEQKRIHKTYKLDLIVNICEERLAEFVGLKTVLPHYRRDN